MRPLSRRANGSACARARLLGTSSPKTIVNRLSSRVTMINESASAEVLRIGSPVDAKNVWRLVVRLTAA